MLNAPDDACPNDALYRWSLVALYSPLGDLMLVNEQNGSLETEAEAPQMLQMPVANGVVHCLISVNTHVSRHWHHIYGSRCSHFSITAIAGFDLARYAAGQAHQVMHRMHCGDCWFPPCLPCSC